jgi:hypothetical protein
MSTRSADRSAVLSYLRNAEPQLTIHEVTADNLEHLRGLYDLPVLMAGDIVWELAGGQAYQTIGQCTPEAERSLMELLRRRLVPGWGLRVLSWDYVVTGIAVINDDQCVMLDNLAGKLFGIVTAPPDPEPRVRGPRGGPK